MASDVVKKGALALVEVMDNDRISIEDKLDWGDQIVEIMMNFEEDEL